jgi:hypothetical protein
MEIRKSQDLSIDVRLTEVTIYHLDIAENAVY